MHPSAARRMRTASRSCRSSPTKSTAAMYMAHPTVRRECPLQSLNNARSLANCWGSPGPSPVRSAPRSQPDGLTYQNSQQKAPRHTATIFTGAQDWGRGNGQENPRARYEPDSIRRSILDGGSSTTNLGHAVANPRIRDDQPSLRSPASCPGRQPRSLPPSAKPVSVSSCLTSLKTDMRACRF